MCLVYQFVAAANADIAGSMFITRYCRCRSMLGNADQCWSMLAAMLANAVVTDIAISNTNANIFVDTAGACDIINPEKC